MDARNEPSHRLRGESGTSFVAGCGPDQYGSAGLAERSPGAAWASPFGWPTSPIVPDSARSRFQKNQSGPDLRYPWANSRSVARIAFTDRQSGPGTYLGLLLNLRRRHRVFSAARYRAAFPGRIPRCRPVRGDDGYADPSRLFSIRDFELRVAGRGMPAQPGLLERQRLSRTRALRVFHRFRPSMAEYFEHQQLC